MTYRVPVRDSGLAAAARSLIRRDHREIQALRQVTFDLAQGEVVGFLGPNGAGKTTAMKILAGILHPTSGDVSILGRTPWDRHRDHLQSISLIRGSQPIAEAPELTVLDSLRHQQVLYDVEESAFKRNLAELGELLELSRILNRQVRALSLGERMRAGLALALVYRPAVLFLDEPTIGLDVTVARAIRTFIADYATQTDATVLLTSHSMADVETLCPRLILIDEGTITFDGPPRELTTAFAPTKIIRATVADDHADLSAYGEVLHHNGQLWTLRLPRKAVPHAAAAMLSNFAVTDLSVEEPTLEDVMDQIYRQAGAE